MTPKHPAQSVFLLTAAALACAPLAACQLQKLPPKDPDPRVAAGGAPAPQPEAAPAGDAGVKLSNDSDLTPSRKPGLHKDGESIPQILARTRDQLQSEVTKNLQLTESLQRANTRVAELETSSKNASKDAEGLRAEKEKLLSKVRELQERLVTAALRIASSEKETLEVKIAYERAVATAAEGGILLDSTGAGVKPDSRPAPNEKGAAVKGAEHR
jgi:hypothetical protein